MSTLQQDRDTHKARPTFERHGISVHAQDGGFVVALGPERLADLDANEWAATLLFASRHPTDVDLVKYFVEDYVTDELTIWCRTQQRAEELVGELARVRQARRLARVVAPRRHMVPLLVSPTS